jgi:small subunit ribosomal protein S13
MGPARAEMILEVTGIVPDMRARELNEEHINRITSFINSAGWKIEDDLRREIVANLKRLQAIKYCRGLRHYKRLPVRGQRTSSNACTRKGTRKRVGVMKKRPSDYNYKGPR